MSSAALKAAATGAATADEARNPYEAFKRQLEGSRSGFLALLGNANAVDRFVRVVLNAVMANPELLEVNRRSLVGAALRAAQDGLLPDGREAVFNVYNTKTSKNEPCHTRHKWKFRRKSSRHLWRRPTQRPESRLHNG
jgi:recombination protein RecT